MRLVCCLVREGLFKLKGSYEQNVALGDPQTVQGEINDLGIRLEKLQTDLEKYQVGSSPSLCVLVLLF